MMQQAINMLIEGHDLSRSQAYEVMLGIMSGEATPAQIGAFLVAAKLKGETHQEVAGFAQAMRERATRVHTRHARAIDMCGTGGDGAGTFNISTVASFLVAAGGVPVAKHGNRSVSSRCGSADLLEALGVNIDLAAEQVGACLDEIGIGFLFAPNLHKAMKYAVGPRREIGVRTVFNILGPLTNPAYVRRQVLGVYHSDLARLMGEVLRELEAEHVMVIHGVEGLDEISPRGETFVVEVRDGRISERFLKPDDFGLQADQSDGILGGAPEDNARIALQVLEGESGPARDVVIINAACGLVVGGAARDFLEGVALAREALDSGAALEKLQALKEMSQRFSHGERA